MKITESQNGQIYPEDTFSHGVAQMILNAIFLQMYTSVKFHNASKFTKLPTETCSCKRPCPDSKLTDTL